MKYKEWNNLSQEEKNKTLWKYHPRIRIMKMFSFLFVIVMLIFVFRVLQNRRVHVNRKPNAKEAFTIAKVFVKDKMQQPATANFTKSDFQADIDTAKNIYSITSYVNAQDSSGKIVKTNWQVKLAYKGGDWSEKASWVVNSLQLY